MYIIMALCPICAETSGLGFWSFLKALIHAIVEGITEWLPVSSTGHLILLEKYLPLDLNPALRELFLVIIQMAAVLAVVFLFWNRLWPIKRQKELSERQILIPLGPFALERSRMILILKLIVASIPAAIFGLLWADWFMEKLYTPLTVAIMLILLGIALYLVELKQPPVRLLRESEISYGTALLIGCAQVLAAALPGTSRSGICILAALLLGLARPLAAEFSFFMAVPAMAGASLLEVLKLSYRPNLDEIILLAVACIASFLVSMLSIEGLMNFVKKHSFQPFALYRIGLGLLVIALLS